MAAFCNYFSFSPPLPPFPFCISTTRNFVGKGRTEGDGHPPQLLGQVCHWEHFHLATPGSTAEVVFATSTATSSAEPLERDTVPLAFATVRAALIHSTKPTLFLWVRR
jgi:hypothetical protein